MPDQDRLPRLFYAAPTGVPHYVYPTRFARWWAAWRTVHGDAGYVTAAELRTLLRDPSTIGGWGYFNAFWLDHWWVRLLRAVLVLVWLAGALAPLEIALVAPDVDVDPHSLPCVAGIGAYLVWLVLVLVGYQYGMARATLAQTLRWVPWIVASGAGQAIGAWVMLQGGWWQLVGFVLWVVAWYPLEYIR